jgi:DNA-binding Lrp family transcriptional regulator
MSSTVKPMLDRYDRKILDVLQRDALTPAARIGDAIGLSAAAVQRRIKRLRQQGVITETVVHADPKALGFPIHCVVGVDLDYESAQAIDRFAQQAQSHPQVQQCYYVTGPTDFMLIVIAHDMEHYEQLTRDLFLSNPNVKSFTTHVVLERQLCGQYIPLEPED